MSNNITKSVWLIGAGSMAVEYAKVLSAMHITPVVIGRGRMSAENFRDKTGWAVAEGGLSAYLQQRPAQPSAVIIAVNTVELAPIAAEVQNYCQTKILLEKPGALTSKDLALLKSCAGTDRLYIAYNRRFFASAQRVKNILQEDGGPVSCTFEFTEWAHRIGAILNQKNPTEMEHWLIANSTHVIDLAFYLAGWPKMLQAIATGSLPWHPAGAAFCGSGLTDRGAVFAYHANWEAPGRWWVEVMSKQRRFKLCPMETVQVQNKGETNWTVMPLDDALEKQFKPGVYSMTAAFLADIPSPELCTFAEFAKHFPLFQKMAGYQD